MNDFTKEEIMEGLEELIKLQAHYARLLNTYDGGKRIGFKSVEQCLLRLRTLKERQRS